MDPNAVLFLVVATVLRFGSIAVSIAWDSLGWRIKYTDIDYEVYRNASRAWLSGGSPYDVPEYRYTPIIAWLVAPTHWCHGCHWLGQAMFAAVDVLVMALLFALADRASRTRPDPDARGLPAAAATFAPAAAAVAVYLLHPVTHGVATRGSSESLVAAAVLVSLVVLLGRPVTRRPRPATPDLQDTAPLAPASLAPAPLAALCGRSALAGALMGLACHLKLYPVVFLLPVCLWLGRERHLDLAARSGRRAASNEAPRRQLAEQPDESDEAPAGGVVAAPAEGSWTIRRRARSRSAPRVPRHAHRDTSSQRASVDDEPAAWSVLGRAGVEAWRALRSAEAWSFAGAAAATAVALAGICWIWYGPPFLEASLLHHLRRRDPQHNFSPFWLHTRWQCLRSGCNELPALQGDWPAWADGWQAWDRSFGWLVRPLAWQLAGAVYFGWQHHRRPVVAALLQAWWLVTLNSVVTAQYFVWYLSLLPVAIVTVPAPRPGGWAAALALWTVAAVHWLLWARLLEHEGRPVEVQLHWAGLLFAASNLLVIASTSDSAIRVDGPRRSDGL